MKWRGKLNLKTGEKSWHTVLCCSRPNKVSCRNHSSTPGISIHTFLKEAKRKQIWMTFTKIHMHRLTWKRNTLPCALSILNHRISAEVCLLGHQWISGGFTLRKVQYYQYTRSQKIHWTLITEEMREDFQLDFFPRNVLWTSYWDPTEKRQYPESHPPPLKKIDFFSDWVSLFEICFQSSEMTDPRPFPGGWAYFRVPSCSTETCQDQTNSK